MHVLTAIIFIQILTDSVATLHIKFRSWGKFSDYLYNYATSNFDQCECVYVWVRVYVHVCVSACVHVAE